MLPVRYSRIANMLATHPERRQDLEHVVVLGLTDLEPLPAKRCASSSVHGRIAARADRTSETFAGGRRRLGRLCGRIREVASAAPFSLVGPERGITPICSSPSALQTPPSRPPLRSGGSRAAQRAKPPLTRRSGMRQQVQLLSYFSFLILRSAMFVRLTSHRWRIDSGAQASEQDASDFLSTLFGQTRAASNRDVRAHRFGQGRFRCARGALQSSFQSPARGRERAYPAPVSSAIARMRSA